MPSSIPVTQRTLQLPQRIQEVQLSDAPAKLQARQAQIMGQQGQAIGERALNNAYLNAQTTMTKEVNRIELENQNDPENMKTALEGWSGKFLQNVYDPEIKGRLNLQLTEHSQAAIARGTARRNQQITEQGQYQTFLAMDSLGSEVDTAATDIFSTDPVVKLSAGRRLQEIMQRGSKILGQTGPDGTPYASPQQRATFLLGLRDSTFESVSRSWIASQPDKLAAAQDWIDGKVEIDMPNGDGTTSKINLRDSMPAAAKTKADSAVMGLLRDQMSLENQRNALADRADQQGAEQGITGIQVALQNDPNSVTIETLDLNSQLFIRGGKGKEYLALRTNLLEGKPIAEDGQIKNQVLGAALRGQDPDNIGLQAFSDKKINYETLVQARNVYNQAKGPADNTLGFYTRQFQTAYGGVNKVLEGTQAEALANGQIMLTSQYQKMTEELKRTPTMQEFEPVYRNTLRAMNTVGGQEISLGGAAAIAPSFISPADLSGPKTPERLNKIQTDVLKQFKTRLGPNPQEWPADDMELIQARRFIKAYEGELQQQNAVKKGTGVE